MQPYTVCRSTATGGYCADGVPPTLPNLSPIDEDMEISWPMAGWEFSASIQLPGEDRKEVDLIARQSLWVIEVDDLDGTYEVSVSGCGPEGDVHYQFSVDVQLSD